MENRNLGDLSAPACAVHADRCGHAQAGMKRFYEWDGNISISPGSFRKNPPQSPFSKGEDKGMPCLIEMLHWIFTNWRKSYQIGSDTTLTSGPKRLRTP
ncbi:MAG: hypothetical protein U9R17_06080 [Thermodesulfobacteriota bacterium]|nr:hypothetical protein [Thermodesulfobacteriota bacterium]